jgi:uncharacterized membrane protein YoaK (UPF0700 family)
LRTLGEATFAWRFQGQPQRQLASARDFSVIVVAFLSGAIAGGATTKAFGNNDL